ncbi:hypothetical protein [Hyalangium rubrum]|uniref:Zinc ribbon domain-containing protein n=1 Tax=Hyalangium rubrum TaxID=3103134 RepID=A0ABU5HHA0_9BACT|nr:hypothetical protein [Hyalangium sp. s54d21]MDY7232835.1 hypothetical protein [Hyalangium sp. s54d21]
MASRFSRFLHLERSRGENEGVGEQPQLQSRGRFEDMADRAEGVDATLVPEAHVERFKRHGETPLALAEKPSVGRRFPRCASCESENGLYSQSCTVCGADLTTPEQRAFNERHWQQQEAQEREAQHALEQEQQRREAHRQEEEDRRAQVISQLYGRNGKKVEASWPRYILDRASRGLGLVGLIPHLAVRWAVLLGALALPLLLMRWGSGWVRASGLLVGIVVILMLIPRSLFVHRVDKRRWFF